MAEHLKNLMLCVATAILITLSFPSMSWWPLAWISLVPFLIALDGKSTWQGIRIGFLCGCLTFSGTLYWLFHITEWFSVVAAVGVVALFLYLSLYYAVFGMYVCRTSQWTPLKRLIVIPSVWVALEWVRGIVFTGFDWISLGHSQAPNLVSIQIADVAGVYGISFVVCMVNVFAAQIRRLPERPLCRRVYLAVFTAILVSHWLYGLIRLSQPLPAKSLTVGVVQGNIEQEMKWAEFAWPMIMKAYRTFTMEVAAEKPDLIIWPETSFPGILGEDDALFGQVEALARTVSIPMMLGAIERRGDDYHNTVLLMGADGRIGSQYDKIHLVPFGEFLPGRALIGPLADLVPISDFTRGERWTVFESPGIAPFSVLICFEDTVARMARPFVQAGAQWLLNMTNDAWFKDSKAADLHLTSSIFRAVENRRSLVRSANTGISSVIDPFGRRLNEVQSEDGRRVDVAGTFVQEVPLNTGLSLYTRFGNVFVFLCIGCILLVRCPKRRIKASQ